MKYLSISVKEIDSTQNIARQIINSGKAKDYNAVIIISEKQTCGRGQKDNKWSSKKGGLYMSVIKKDEERRLKEIPKLSLKIAKIVSKEINKNYNIKTKIKKPNDVYARTRKGYKKIAGILIETIPYENYRFIIIGIGVNFHNQLPDELKEKATSIFEIKKRKYNIKDFALKIFKEIENSSKYEI